ncbi:uncharacterized protein LOC117182522, partial [Belonocnema kinseyi]|uniref:uncharacterized protein LOC117182522 n=1 Tax=Belonocnema kinseyi TaxID=2817044 RepID=UPI00143CEA93
MSTLQATFATTKKAAVSKEINFNALLAAIKDNLLKKKAIRAAALEYGVDRITLTRHVKKVSDHFTDISTVSDVDLLEFIRTSNTHIPSNMVFSPSQEKVLVEYILKCVNHYYGLSINELKELAYQFAVKLKVDYPECWNENSKAGRMWYRGFMKRNNMLTLRTPEQTSMNRVKAFCKANVDTFFLKLGQLLDKHHFDSTSIYNMDESGFSTVPTKIGKVIALKEARRVDQLEAAERGTMITMALSVSASGKFIPPFFLFPRKNMQACFMDNTSSGAAGFANSSGWMCQEEFVRFMEHFIKFVKPIIASPVLLLLDNHASHLSVDALDLAAANG